ncbi:hypothetical protein F2Q70_00034627 [Brassica cretica]|uniref:Uncharacterized protein n=1 Tax=Brassica cretica TaxID=69181 RepID=A0A8S9JYV8_BRACR|nr:hypothetical protein F2Q70_00034627 [Brassica cretica]
MVLLVKLEDGFLLTVPVYGLCSVIYVQWSFASAEVASASSVAHEVSGSLTRVCLPLSVAFGCCGGAVHGRLGA